jgi:hypothetical protein
MTNAIEPINLLRLGFSFDGVIAREACLDSGRAPSGSQNMRADRAVFAAPVAETGDVALVLVANGYFPALRRRVTRSAMIGAVRRRLPHPSAAHSHVA